MRIIVGHAHAIQNTFQDLSGHASNFQRLPLPAMPLAFKKAKQATNAQICCPVGSPRVPKLVGYTNQSFRVTKQEWSQDEHFVKHETPGSAAAGHEEARALPRHSVP
jgi:hypothetical protein